MVKELTYFWLNDLKLVAKMEDYVSYIYRNGKWEVDNDNIVNDRFIGYDPNEGIGNIDMLMRIEEITEEEAKKLILDNKAS